MAAVDRKRTGRPTKYKPEYAEAAYHHCLLGATDADLARRFGVTDRTIESWRNAHPEFLRSVHAGRDEADEKVTKSLYQRALGYSHKAVKIFMPAGAAEPVYAEYIEHYPPDTQAASLWLRNRQPAKWRDKQHVEHTGKDGGPISHELSSESRALLEETTAGLSTPVHVGANGTVKH